MLTLYDVPWKRNILRVCERSRRADLRSRSAKNLVMRLSFRRFAICSIALATGGV